MALGHTDIHIKSFCPSHALHCARLCQLIESRTCYAMSQPGSADQTPRLSMAEKGIIRQMHFDQGMSRTRIACLLKRSLSTVSRLLAQKKAPRSIGRPRVLSGAKIDRICTLLDNMVDDAGGNREVTLAMLMRRARLKASERTVSDALHSRGYRFRNMRSKPILTPDDVKERLAWATKHRTKSVVWWLQNVHIHLDNHVFKRAATSQGMGLACQAHRVWGLPEKSRHSPERREAECQVEGGPSEGNPQYWRCWRW